MNYRLHRHVTYIFIIRLRYSLMVKLCYLFSNKRFKIVIEGRTWCVHMRDFGTWGVIFLWWYAVDTLCYLYMTVLASISRCFHTCSTFRMLVFIYYYKLSRGYSHRLHASICMYVDDLLKMGDTCFVFSLQCVLQAFMGRFKPWYKTCSEG